MHYIEGPCINTFIIIKNDLNGNSAVLLHLAFIYILPQLMTANNFLGMNFLTAVLNDYFPFYEIHSKSNLSPL